MIQRVSNTTNFGAKTPAAAKAARAAQRAAAQRATATPAYTKLLGQAPTKTQSITEACLHPNKLLPQGKKLQDIRYRSTGAPR